MEKNLSERLGEKLRILRESQGYSQEYLSKILKISPSAYARMERGETTMNITRLEEIAKIFHLTISQLMSIVENNNQVFHVTNNHNSFGSVQSTFHLLNDKTELENLKAVVNNLQILVEVILKKLENQERNT